MVSDLRPRLIPCLLIQNGGLTKTTKFGNHKYVGDPINAVRIFNEKAVDEIIILDINASRDSKQPDFTLISKLARECRMPLCYGGGVKTSYQIQHIISLGVEKVAISSSAINNPQLIKESSAVVGSQSIVVVLDIKRTGFLKNSFDVFIHNGTVKTNLNLLDFIRNIQDLGAGEIVLNSIDQDGTMSGYDFDLIDKIFESIKIPITVIGGAGSLDDIKKLYDRYGNIGAAAGSLFVFKGKYRAVLIQYPSELERSKFISGLI